MVFLLWFLSASAGGGPHNRQARKEQTKEPPQPAYDVELTITNVEVIITDEDGNRITGLRPENFELYEDGHLQKLTNFYEVKRTRVTGSAPEEEISGDLEPTQAGPTKIPRIENRLIFFFDNWHLHPRNRNWITGKLGHFIRTNFGEGKGNLGMVVFLDRKLEIIQDFTPVPGAILRAVDRVKKRSGEAISRMREREELSRELNRIAMESTSAVNMEQYRRSMDFARSYVEEEANILRYALKSLDAFTGFLSGIKGRKVLIYICDGLPLNPAREVFTFIEQNYHLGNAQAEAMNYNVTQTFKELAARCNAREIAIYPVNAGVFEAGFDSADRDQSWNIRSRGTSLYRTNPAYKKEALELMAAQTGGSAVLSSGSIEDGLETITNDLNHYYSLGYRSPHRADGRYHSLSLKLVGVDKDYGLRIRKGYMKSSSEERIAENVLARLFIPYQENPLGIQIQDLPDEKLANGKTNLVLKLLIPLKNIALMPRKSEYIGQIKIYVAFLDSQNNWSDPYELEQEIRIPEEDFRKARTRNYPYLTELHLEPERYVVSIAVSDTAAKAITYLQVYRDLRN